MPLSDYADRAFYLDVNREHITALTERTDTLLDGRLPRTAVLLTPDDGAVITHGARSGEVMQKQIQDWEGVSTELPTARKLAENQNTATCAIATTMVRAVVDMGDVWFRHSETGQVLEQVGAIDRLLPPSYTFATWRQTALRMNNAQLVRCNATRVTRPGFYQENAMHEITLEENVTRQSLTIVTLDETIFSVGLEVGSVKDALYKHCEDLLNNRQLAAALLSGTGDSPFAVAERVHEFLQAQRAKQAEWTSLPGATQLVQAIYKRALAVRHTREMAAEKVMPNMPTTKTLQTMRRLLRA